MIKSRITKNRILIVFSLIAALVLGSINLSYAADNVSMPDLEGTTSTLIVKTEYTDEDVTTPIKGMELTIYKVASLSVKNGTANYTATKEFKPARIDFNKLTTGSSIDAAEKLKKIVESNKLEGRKAESNSSGEADFGSVEHGMYLVMQTGATGDASEYTRLRPYIIMAPQPLTDIGKNAWQYDVVSIPKMEVVNQIVNLTKKVNSEDYATVEDRSAKFSYDIVADISSAPDSFAVVDNVPEPLEVVDIDMIEVRVNGNKLDDNTKKSILKIDGNTVRVEPTKAQIDAWAPFEMTVLFYCKFREDITISEENAEVINVAGYEVNGVYYEPPGDENQASVKGVFEDATQVKAQVDAAEEDKKDDGSRTGDDFGMYLGILMILMVVSALAVILVLRRRRANS